MEFKKRQAYQRTRGWRGHDTIFSLENYKDIEYCEDDLPNNTNRPSQNYHNNVNSYYDTINDMDNYGNHRNPMAISTAGNYFDSPVSYWQGMETGVLNPTQVLQGSGTNTLSMIFLCMTLIVTIGMVIIVILVYLLK